jgi:hypothetical protein
LAIFFKAQPLTAMDDFTIWKIDDWEEGQPCFFRQAEVLQGLKPGFVFSPLRPD